MVIQWFYLLTYVIHHVTSGRIHHMTSGRVDNTIIIYSGNKTYIIAFIGTYYSKHFC